MSGKGIEIMSICRNLRLFAGDPNETLYEEAGCTHEWSMDVNSTETRERCRAAHINHKV